MTVIRYQDTEVQSPQGYSLLETLEGAGFLIPFSCRAGVCHSCMMKSEGDASMVIPASAQKGLTNTQIAQGYFLACCCYPSEDMNVRLKGTTDSIKGKVLAKKMLNDTVISLSIQADCKWLAGQYLNLWKDELNARPYSIASRCDQEKRIELHIKRHPHGVVSQWLHDDVNIDDLVDLSSPTGDCFYTDDHYNKPLLMVCTGTGLAPLYGILKEAIAQNHQAPIDLYYAAAEPHQLYYQHELATLTQHHDNINVIPVVKRQAQEGMLEGDLGELIKARHATLSGWKVFLCGAPAMVNTLQRQCFFKGAAVSDILCDAFDSAVPAPT